MYWLAFASSIITGRKRYLYSERWYDGVDRGANLKRRMFLRFTHVLVPGIPQLEYYRALGVPPRRLELIPSLYCPAAQASPSRQAPERFVFVGRALPLKGLDRFLSALSQLPEVAGVVVIGSDDNQFAGNDPTYRETCLARASALPNVVVVQNLSEVETVLTPGSVLVVPNRIMEHDPVSRESWGRVVEEALFAGIPVIATDSVPCALTLVKDGVNGCVIPHGDDGALLPAMRDALAGKLTCGQGDNGATVTVG
jgi:glycosyltransferase involved in cell wall biosynthesis